MRRPGEFHNRIPVACKSDIQLCVTSRRLFRRIRIVIVNNRRIVCRSSNIHRIALYRSIRRPDAEFPSRKERKARRNCRTAPSTRCCSPETSGDSEFLSRPGRLLHTFTCRRCKRHLLNHKIAPIFGHFTFWVPALRGRPIVSNFYVAVQSDICRIVTGANTQHRAYRKSDTTDDCPTSNASYHEN